MARATVTASARQNSGMKILVQSTGLDIVPGIIAELRKHQPDWQYFALAVRRALRLRRGLEAAGRAVRAANPG